MKIYKNEIQGKHTQETYQLWASILAQDIPIEEKAILLGLCESDTLRMLEVCPGFATNSELVGGLAIRQPAQ